MHGRASTVTLLGLVIGLMAACATAPATQEGKDELVRRAAAGLKAWDRAVPGIERFAQGNLGYIMFPEINKGGVGIGGAYGRGVVYARGQHIGYADLSLGSLGPQLGGQTYQELIVFADEATFARFRRGRFDVTAATSMVLATEGYAGALRTAGGAAILYRPTGGAMGELVLAAQHLTFAPK